MSWLRQKNKLHYWPQEMSNTKNWLVVTGDRIQKFKFLNKFKKQASCIVFLNEFSNFG